MLLANALVWPAAQVRGLAEHQRRQQVGVVYRRGLAGHVAYAVASGVGYAGQPMKDEVHRAAHLRAAVGDTGPRGGGQAFGHEGRDYQVGRGR